MSLCLSSFWVVWLHRHKFSPPPFLYLSCFPLARSWSKSTLIDLLLHPVCKLSLQFLSFIPHLGHSSSLYPCCFYPFGNDLSLQLSAIFFPVFPSPSLLVYSKPTLLFSFCYFVPLLLYLSLPSPPSPYRWRLTGECSTIRPHDCLLLRRWMEAPSASPTQPQLHQPP